MRGRRRLDLAVELRAEADTPEELAELLDAGAQDVYFALRHENYTVVDVSGK